MSAAQRVWLPLGEMLVERGLLGERQLELALVEQRRTSRPLGEVLVGLRFVSHEVLTAALLDQVGLAEPPPPPPSPPSPPDPPEPPELEPAVEAEPKRERPVERSGPEIVEPEPEPERPQRIVVRMDSEERKRDRKAAAKNVRELESLVAEFDKRSREINEQIAEIRRVVAQLNPAARAAT